MLLFSIAAVDSVDVLCVFGSSWIEHILVNVWFTSNVFRWDLTVYLSFKNNNMHTLSWFSMASFRIKPNILDLWGPPSPSSINNYTRNTANLPLCCFVIHSIIFQDESQVSSDCCFALLLCVNACCCLWVYSHVGAWWPTYSVNPPSTVSVCTWPFTSIPWLLLDIHRPVEA